MPPRSRRDADSAPRYVGEREPITPPSDDPAVPPAPAESVASLPTRADDGAQAPVAQAARFGDAARAAAYLGQLIDIAEARPTAYHDGEHWWVDAEMPLNLGRELVELAGGRGFVRRESRLVPDPGWGPEPADDASAIPVPARREVPPLELIQAAGLRPRQGAPRDLVIVLVPAARAWSLMRRALDLRLDAAFRPVKVRPLLAAWAAGETTPARIAGTLIEVRLQVPDQVGLGRPHIPMALLSALDANPQALVCREVSPQLYVQHDRRSPLTDRQLDALVEDETWVLADPPQGCWALRSLAELADAATLAVLGPAHQLTPGDEHWPDPGENGEELAWLPEPVPVKIVPAPRTTAALDAVLLDGDELAALKLLLEGHPLAESAVLVPGRDRHLLLATGGIIEQIPLGEYLSCVGPGPIYVAHGWRTEPLLPAAAWRQLTGLMPQTALVLQPDRTLAFDLTLRRPVWELWAGELPPLDQQLPPEAIRILTEMDVRPAIERPARTEKAQPPGFWDRRRRRGDRNRGSRPVSWQEQALEAELRHDLVQAARLHDQHGDPLRAARLYERAAYEGQPEPGP